jgi:hypothetical protein
MKAIWQQIIGNTSMVIDIDLKRVKQDLDRFNEIALQLLMRLQASAPGEGGPLDPEEVTRLSKNIVAMKLGWDKHIAELNASTRFELPAGLSRSQRQAIGQLIQEAFGKGFGRAQAAALAERFFHEIQRVRGTLPRYEG